MFSQVEAVNYRSLRDISQSLDRFHTLVGPNASGKSSFLDVIRFLSDMMEREGVEVALRERAPTWQDLVWMRSGSSFELAVEADIPEEIRSSLENPRWNRCRYQVRIGQTSKQEPVGILRESLRLRENKSEEPSQIEIWPDEERRLRSSLLREKARRGVKTVVKKVEGGNDNFYDETGSGWDHAFKLGPQRSALANLPEDENKFPTSTWFKRLLVDGIDFIHLDSDSMQKASPPGKGTAFLPDGSNLPWVIRHLSQEDPETFDRWLRHIRTALGDLRDIDTVVREEDRHCYIRVEYENGVRVPSWGLSDGTLRLLALTILPYLSDTRGTYLIEEPENGIHPRAVETVYSSLSSVYDSQVLVATHSPVFLSASQPRELLCFAKDDAGRSAIVRGSEHPRLSRWQQETDLGTLFAGGVLS
jgi:predicted ATPase